MPNVEINATSKLFSMFFSMDSLKDKSVSHCIWKRKISPTIFFFGDYAWFYLLAKNQPKNVDFM